MDKVCKVVGIVFLGITLLTGVVLGLMQSSFLVFLVLLINGFVSFVSFYALGEILEYVQIINGNILRLFREVKKEKTETQNKGYAITRIAEED